MIIKDSVVFITGGASGLGAEVAKAIVKKEGKVIIADMNEKDGDLLVKQLGKQAFFTKCDVTCTEENQAAIQSGMQKFGKITGLVNAAGIAGADRTIGRNGPADLQRFMKAISINLVGSFDMIRLCAWEMIKNEANENGERGVIVNVASIAAFDGQIGQAAYAASKAGVVGMTLPIARDLSREGIRINSIAPGIFNTPMMQAMPQEVRDSLGATVPFPKRLGEPHEFASLVLEVLTNPYLNGETIRLDGAIRMPPK